MYSSSITFPFRGKLSVCFDEISQEVCFIILKEEYEPILIGLDEIQIFRENWIYQIKQFQEPIIYYNEITETFDVRMIDDSEWFMNEYILAYLENRPIQYYRDTNSYEYIF